MVKKILRPLAGLLACGIWACAQPGFAHEHPVASPMAQHWQARLAAAKGTALSVALDAQGRLWSVSMRQGQLWLARSLDGGRTFTEMAAVNAQMNRDRAA